MEKGVRSLLQEIIIRRKLDRPFTEAEIFTLFSGITQGLLYLHKECSIFHKDLKPANIILFNTGQKEIGKDEVMPVD